MSWVRLADEMLANPKVLGLSDRAFRLYIGLLCWCSAWETDGAFNDDALRAIPDGRRLRNSLEDLIVSGLILVRDEGWEIHDFLDYQPSKEQKRQTRKAATSRQRASRARRDSERDSRRDGAVTSRAQDPLPLPGPVPSDLDPSSVGEPSYDLEPSVRALYVKLISDLGIENPPQRWVEGWMERGALVSDFDHAIGIARERNAKTTRYINPILKEICDDRSAGRAPKHERAASRAADGAERGDGGAARTGRVAPVPPGGTRFVQEPGWDYANKSVADAGAPEGDAGARA